MEYPLLDLDDAINNALFHIDEAFTVQKNLDMSGEEDTRLRRHLVQARGLLTECYTDMLRQRIASDQASYDEGEGRADAQSF